jgi:UDP-glucose 4-epimerase
VSKGKILVVGGAGFIGSHVNQMLHESGYDTVIFDSCERSFQTGGLPGSLVTGNTGNIADLERVFGANSFDAVMHFAAYIDIGESFSRPADYYRNNTVNALNLLQTMCKFNVKKLIFSSTAAIFGAPDQLPVDETHRKKPITPYGESKLMVETMLADFDRSYGLKSICFRYFNAAGGDPKGRIPNNKERESNLIPRLLRNLKNRNEKMTLNGTDYPTPDGTCVRDYIHVCDIGHAHILGMEKLLNGSESNAYNLGNGSGFSNRQVIQAVEKVTGRVVEITEGPRRQGDPPILIADSKKAVKELHWKPKYSDLPTIVAHAWGAMNRD